MQTTAVVLGVLGGVFGVLSAALLLALGAGTRALTGGTGGSGDHILGAALVGTALSIAAIVAAALASRKPLTAGALMLAFGFGLFLAIGWFAVVPALLLLAAALIALLSRPRAAKPEAAGAGATVTAPAPPAAPAS